MNSSPGLIGSPHIRKKIYQYKFFEVKHMNNNKKNNWL